MSDNRLRATPKDPGSHGRDSAASRAARASSEIGTDALRGPAASDNRLRAKPRSPIRGPLEMHA